MEAVRNGWLILKAKREEGRGGHMNGGKKRQNPFSVYAVVSQVGFMVVVPLLLFFWGGSWLINRFSLPGWLMIVFAVTGIAVMISSVGTYLKKMIKMYDSKEEKTHPLHHDLRDHDYFED